MDSSDITSILRRLSDGENGAVDELIPVVYQQMRMIAAKASSADGIGSSSPTELVHEAYIRLIGNEKLAWQSRSHFFGACGSVIRRILVDQARARKTAKRGAGRPTVDLPADLAQQSSVDLLELELALERLEELAPRQVRLIELRYFAGLSETEAAEVMGVSRRTVSGDWAMAKAWLRSQLDG